MEMVIVKNGKKKQQKEVWIVKQVALYVSMPIYTMIPYECSSKWT